MNKFIINPDEPKLRFKIGSQAFFSNYAEFEPSDLDEVEFTTEPKLFKNFLQIRAKDRSRCLFIWRKMSPDEFVDYALNSPLPMEAGKFLVPEVAEYLGFTIEHLKKLESVFERLDERHDYEKIIFRSYIENGSFTLTDEQRAEAFQAYRIKRT